MNPLNEAVSSEELVNVSISHEMRWPQTERSRGDEPKLPDACLMLRWLADAGSVIVGVCLLCPTSGEPSACVASSTLPPPKMTFLLIQAWQLRRSRCDGAASSVRRLLGPCHKFWFMCKVCR